MKFWIDAQLPPLLAEWLSAKFKVEAFALRTLGLRDAAAALTNRLDYLEWKEKAIAEGQSDLDNDRVVTTAQIRESLAKQRAQRAAKSKTVR